MYISENNTHIGFVFSLVVQPVLLSSLSFYLPVYFRFFVTFLANQANDFFEVSFSFHCQKNNFG